MAAVFVPCPTPRQRGTLIRSTAGFGPSLPPSLRASFTSGPLSRDSTFRQRLCAQIKRGQALPLVKVAGSVIAWRPRSPPVRPEPTGRTSTLTAAAGTERGAAFFLRRPRPRRAFLAPQPTWPPGVAGNPLTTSPALRSIQE